MDIETRFNHAQAKAHMKKHNDEKLTQKSIQQLQKNKQMLKYDPNPLRQNGSMVTASRNNLATTRNVSFFKRVEGVFRNRSGERTMDTDDEDLSIGLSDGSKGQLQASVEQERGAVLTEQGESRPEQVKGAASACERNVNTNGGHEKNVVSST